MILCTELNFYCHGHWHFSVNCKVVNCLAPPKSKSYLLKLCRKALSGKSLLRTFLDWSSERKHRTDDKWVHGECKCPSDITYCPRWQPQLWRWKVWTTYFNGWHTSPKIINLNRFLPRQKASRLSSAAVVRHLVKSLIPIPADFCQKPPYPPAPHQTTKRGNFEGLLRSVVWVIGQSLFSKISCDNSSPRTNIDLRMFKFKVWFSVS